MSGDESRASAPDGLDAVLPCTCGRNKPWVDKSEPHPQWCPAYYRPAVRAWAEQVVEQRLRETAEKTIRLIGSEGTVLVPWGREINGRLVSLALDSDSASRILAETHGLTYDEAVHIVRKVRDTLDPEADNA